MIERMLSFCRSRTCIEKCAAFNRHCKSWCVGSNLRGTRNACLNDMQHLDSITWSLFALNPQQAGENKSDLEVQNQKRLLQLASQLKQLAFSSALDERSLRATLQQLQRSAMTAN